MIRTEGRGLVHRGCVIDRHPSLNARFSALAQMKSLTIRNIWRWRQPHYFPFHSDGIHTRIFCFPNLSTSIFTFVREIRFRLLSPNKKIRKLRWWGCTSQATASRSILSATMRMRNTAQISHFSFVQDVKRVPSAPRYPDFEVERSLQYR